MLFYGNMLCGTAAFCKPFPKEMICCKKDGGKIFPLLFGGGQKAFFVRHHPSGYFFLIQNARACCHMSTMSAKNAGTV